MTRLFAITLIALLITAPFTVPVAADIEDHREAIDELVMPLIDQQVIVGMAIGLIAGDESLVLGYGRLDLNQPAAPDENTLFEIGSLTKTFTSLMLAMAVERGELEYTQTAKSLLPAGKRMPMFEGTEILLEHLATHTSALPRLPDNLQPPNPNNPYARYTADKLYVFLSYWGLDTQPGDTYLYSNLGVGLLGHLLSRRANQSYEASVIEQVCKPLGMNDTSITMPSDAKSRFATPYNADCTEVSYWDFAVLDGAGGLRSTAGDMVKYLRAQIDHGPAPIGPAAAKTQVPRHATDQEELSIGLGWHVTEDGTCTHSGGTGGFVSYATFDPDKRVGVIVLCNTAANQAYDLGPKLRSLLLGEAYDSFELPTIVQLDPASLDRYVGRYQLFPGFDLHINRDGDNLTVQATDQPTFRIYPRSATDFFYRIVDAQITFVVNESGEINKLILHQAGRDTPAARLE